MEEAAGDIYGRFLDAENLAEVLMGISKELAGWLQIVQFNLNGSIQREAEAKSELLDCVEQLKAKESALKRLEKINPGPYVSQREETTSIKVNVDESEVFSLREKIKLLEEQLKESELVLKDAQASNEAHCEHLIEIENRIESLKEDIIKSESKAGSAEGKLTLLTETNLELTEEMGFLKDSTIEKVSMLEKQLRDLGIQLQHAKASSEASQEQQNMLYSAIWDMETLIEELKSKVSKAETMTENAEEQCIMLSETNFELNKELNFLRDKMDCLEKTLHQVKGAKTTSAEDISIRTRLIMDMVLQLAFERERIQKQVLTFLYISLGLLGLFLYTPFIRFFFNDTFLYSFSFITTSFVACSVPLLHAHVLVASVPCDFLLDNKDAKTLINWLQQSEILEEDSNIDDTEWDWMDTTT